MDNDDDDEKVGKYLVMRKHARPSKRKTDVWEVVSTSGALLGVVRWYGAWRQFCFFPGGGSIFNHRCLRDLSIFLDRVTMKHKGDKDV